MGKKGDLSDFERGMVVGARRAGLSISKTADLYVYIYIYIYISSKYTTPPVKMIDDRWAGLPV